MGIVGVPDRSEYAPVVATVASALVLAFKSRAACVAVETGLLASDVLSTLPSPTCAAVTSCGLVLSATWSAISPRATVSSELTSPLAAIVCVPSALSVIVMFAPLYLSNYCINHCVYCPFHKNNKQIPRKKLTQEEFNTRLLERNIHIRNKSITILSPYTGMNHNITCYCSKCNTTYTTTIATSLYNGSGCPKCSRAMAGYKQRKSNEQFQLELANLRKSGHDIYCDDTYKTSNTKLTFYCSKNHI